MTAGLVKDTEADILEDRVFQDQAIVFPVFRHQRDPMLDCLFRAVAVDLLSFQFDFAFIRIDPEDRPKDLRPSCADQPAEAQDFTGADVEIHAVNSAVL